MSNESPTRMKALQRLLARYLRVPYSSTNFCQTSPLISVVNSRTDSFPWTSFEMGCKCELGSRYTRGPSLSDLTDMTFLPAPKAFSGVYYFERWTVSGWSRLMETEAHNTDFDFFRVCVSRRRIWIGFNRSFLGGFGALFWTAARLCTLSRRSRRRRCTVTR